MKLADREAVIDKLVYAATNPVQDHLVDRIHHWPGVNGPGALLTGRPLRATRPLHFFRPDGPMPEALKLPLTIPAELGRTGRRVLGRRAVLAQSWCDSLASVEPRRNLRPHVAGRSKWARIEALLRNGAFAREYASARERWPNGIAAMFPPDTYWHQRFASVPVLEA